MTGALRRWLFGRPKDASDRAYEEAMGVSNDLIARMREAGDSTDAARAVMADIWAQNHNIPFLTTVYESVQEAKSGPESDKNRG
jgi:hypothetical protein